MCVHARSQQRGHSINIRMSYLYCIGSSNGMIKYGYSKDPASRLRSLQTGSSDELVLLESVCVGDRDVRACERELHREFAVYRTRGEWFCLEPTQAVDLLRWFSIRYLSED